MQLSKYFTLEQLSHSDTADQNGIDNTPDSFAQGNLQSLAVLLDTIYDTIGPFTITSGYRSPSLNSFLQQNHPTSNTSLHMRGMAADILPMNDSADGYFWKLAASGARNLTGEIINEAQGEGVVHISLPYTDSLGVDRRGYLKYLSGGSYYPYSSSEISAKTGGSASQDDEYGVEEYADDYSGGSSLPIVPILLTATVLGALLFMVTLQRRSHA